MLWLALAALAPTAGWSQASPPPEAQPPVEEPAPPPPPAPAPPSAEEAEPPAIETAPPPPPPRISRPAPAPLAVHPRVAAVRQSPRYEPALAALVRVLGASHALRVACRGKSDQVYRGRMNALLDLEAPLGDDRRRRALVETFNAAFEAETARTPRCDAAAPRKEADLARQGRALAQNLRDLYASAPPQTGPQP